MGPKLLTHTLVLPLLLLAAIPAWAQTGTITGIIRDAESGRGLATARVEAVVAGGRAVGSTLTNAEGRYRLRVGPGQYELSVESVGYEVAIRAVPVSVTDGEVVTADIDLRAQAFSLNPVIVTASKRQERSTDAPARVEVITEQDIRTRPAVTPTDHLRATPGVDVITQGVQSTNVVVRGFNNIFSGALATMTDHRIAGVPSLRVNVLHFIPTLNEDLQRMEVVLGPGAALYGPNTASGVLHMITKSPLMETGSTVSLVGGERDVFQGSFRTAQRLGDRVGFKLSGQLMRGSDWEFLDQDEVAERAKFDSSQGDFFREDLMRALRIDGAEADIRIARIGARDNDIRRVSGEARVDWRATDNLTTVVQAGVTNVGSGVELTGLGAALVKDWRYSYYQLRVNQGRFFGQAYLNTSNAGDSFLLRTGQPVVDESVMFVGQLQHGFQASPWQSFTYGLDYIWTDPRTKGTINGIYEDRDETTERGVYLQSETSVMPWLDVVLAGRVDDHTGLPDAIFSPRAALVVKFADERALRLTFNRAFSTPSSINQFLDLPTSMPNQASDPLAAAAARLGYSVRVQGTGTSGFTFQQPDGSFVMRSPFTPQQLGGPAQLLPANAAAFFAAAVQVVAQQSAAAGQPLSPQLVQYLSSLQPTAAQIGTNFIAGNQSLPISALDLPPVAPIRETTTSTFEIGYKGVIQRRFSVAADGWVSRIQDFVTPLTVRTPLLAMDGPSIGAYLVPRFMQDLGMSQQDAVALAGALAPGLAQVPVGVISSQEINANGAQLLATYTNVDDHLDLRGADISVQALITPEWSVTASGSIVNRDYFETSVGIVTLNAAKRKGSVGLAYRGASDGLNGEVRVRHHAGYPVRSGVFEGYGCIPGAATATACVDDATLLDFNVGYTIPQMRGVTLQLAVQNALDHDYRSFPGVPDVGRMGVLRLRYEF
jgi:outer membrane receptor for ferrienterochelin and colicins